MKSNFWQRHPILADTLGIFVFVFSVTLGTILINTFIFQSFTIVGSSMDPTFADGDKVIINRLPSTWANFTNTKFTPKRGEIIVFENPQFINGMKDQYIIKRVIAFPGEKVKVEKGKIIIQTVSILMTTSVVNQKITQATMANGLFQKMKSLFQAIIESAITLTILEVV